MFHKILVAYDGSETARIALNKAIELKQVFVESILEVVHVFQISNLVLNDAIIPEPVMIQAELYQAAEEVVAEARLLVAPLSLATVTLLDGGGAPARVILDYAEAHQFELVIVGSRGMGNFKEIFLGSVSSEIVHHAQVPVLVVK
ncbi:universal stress protein [Paenibacillus agricola]|uniref:Universal stress protein n=1 Tax=Paenibacillus agricola TaxID=2716264 RepID=A0ABX0IZ20_9BACL|nr:universal stress protein [Paenibacillus agricola]NHN29242.1 universal stress protein [Paenibacillus agricola]